MLRSIFLTLAILSCLPCAIGQTDSTWYRNKWPEHLRYVLIPEQPADASVKVSKMTLQEPLLNDDHEWYLTVEVYNVLFKDRLAAFSLMPSFDHRAPVWAKIDLDTIKNKLVNIKDLPDTINAEIKAYPSKRFLRNNLKFNNYVLITKKKDGYYCSATDCITEFFEIIDNPAQQKNKAYQINMSAPQLTVAEYESSYRKRRGYYSQNFPSMEGFNEEATNGDVLFRSFNENVNGKKRSHYWLFGIWGHDSANAQRGSERFIFEVGVGLVGASYDFVIPKMKEYWYEKLSQGLIPSERTKAAMIIAFEQKMLFEKYLTEYTIPVLTEDKP